MQSDRPLLPVLLAAIVLGGATVALAVPAGAQAGNGAETDGSLVVVDLSAPDSAAPNATINVAATVENSGTSETSEMVEFRLEGTVLDRQRVTLDPGDRETVEFDVNTTGLETGDYLHGVVTESDGAFATLTVSESFTVSGLSAPANATSGDNITVEADVTNPNDFNTTQMATYRFDGGVVSSVELTLGPGETANVSQNVTLGGIAEGSYVHGVLTRDAGQLAMIEIAAGNASEEAPTVNFSDQASDGSTVVVDTTMLPLGGFVTIHDETLLEGNVVGSVVGVSEPLPAGASENVSIELFAFPGSDNTTALEESGTFIAMPHLDTNGNGIYDFVISDGAADGPYIADGGPVVDAANVTVDDEEAEPPETPEPPEPTETESPEDETESPEDETESPEDETESPEDETESPEDETESPEDETESPEDETEIDTPQAIIASLF